MTSPGAAQSVSFDRAAEYYDETRSRTSATMEALVDLLVAELAGRGQCLEVGVGTGRIALPLARAGVQMAGVDIAPEMLARLAEKAGGRAPFPVAIADATALPFPDDWFGAALVSHVLQLVPNWPSAVAELVRVVTPGGVVVIDLGWRRGIRRELQGRFAAEAGLRSIDVGLDPERVADLDAEFAAFGAELRELPQIVETGAAPLAELLNRMAAGQIPVTWPVEEHRRRAAAAAVANWAERRFGPLDEPRPLETIVAMRAYDVA